MREATATAMKPSASAKDQPAELSDQERVVEVLRRHAWVQGRWLHKHGRCACGWKPGHVGRARHIDHPQHVAQRISKVLANSNDQSGGLKEAATQHSLKHFLWALIKAKLGVPHV